MNKDYYELHDMDIPSLEEQCELPLIVVVDFQYDFLPVGELPVPTEGAEDTGRQLAKLFK